MSEGRFAGHASTPTPAVTSTHDSRLTTHDLLLLRADASPAAGFGHVMRALALVQAWRDRGGTAVCATAGDPAPVARRLADEGVEVVALAAEPGSRADALATRNLAAARGAAWVAADGYAFGPDWQDAVAGSARLLVVDDHGLAGRWPADIVLNPNLSATVGAYRGRTAARLLAGPRFALLRREFAAPPPPRDPRAPVRRVLVTMGGTDPAGMTPRVLRALQLPDFAGLEIEVLAGSVAAAKAALEAAGDDRARVHVTVGATDVAARMARAHLAVTAGGVTCAELVNRGVPSIAVIVADNQRDAAGVLGAAGAVDLLGWHADVHDDAIATALLRLAGDPDARAAMLDAGRGLLDGVGAGRVADALDVPGGAPDDARLAVRAATPADAVQVWALASDPDVRAVSFWTDPIPLASHFDWFRRRLADPGCRFRLLTLDGGLAGQVRYERTGDGVAEVSISMDRAARGRGWGVRLLDATGDDAARDLRAPVLRALTLPDNLASVRVFLKAGYLERPAAERDGRPCRIFEREAR
jgi:UDP-2,4-diacetamido-2,4,6-trideoxy-beta-L-altropyranose hydrolase